MDPAPRTIEAVLLPLDARSGFRLRPWNEDWATTLVDAWQDPEVAKWNPVPPDPSLELAGSWIRGTAEQNEASVGVDVVMVEVSSGLVAGEIGLQVDPSQGIAEVGFWLSAGFRGQGSAKVLLALAVDLAKELELAGLVALVDPANEAAIGLLEAVGWPELPTKTQRRAFAQRTG